jgi:hypothetical protein
VHYRIAIHLLVNIGITTSRHHGRDTPSEDIPPWANRSTSMGPCPAVRRSIRFRPEGNIEHLCPVMHAVGQYVGRVTSLQSAPPPWVAAKSVPERFRLEQPAERLQVLPRGIRPHVSSTTGTVRFAVH